jgi:hypothetical protein
MPGRNGEESRVNPRHAAALALVGWYLMILPITIGKLPNGSVGPKLDLSANLSTWETVGAFDSAVGCNQMRLGVVEKAKEEDLGTPSASSTDLTPLRKLLHMTQGLAAQCVSTDDPRLKAK